MYSPIMGIAEAATAVAMLGATGAIIDDNDSDTFCSGMLGNCCAAAVALLAAGTVGAAPDGGQVYKFDGGILKFKPAQSM